MQHWLNSGTQLDKKHGIIKVMVEFSQFYLSQCSLNLLSFVEIQ